MDETYIKVHGQWVYLYRAVDKAGQTVDFVLSRNRDVNVAKSFLRSAIENARVSTKFTLDAYAASHRAVREMKEDGELPCRTKIRSSQYLNNLVEQDHRRVKQRIRPMLGFKRFDNAAVTVSGVELAKKIKKGQYKTGKLRWAIFTLVMSLVFVYSRFSHAKRTIFRRICFLFLTRKKVGTYAQLFTLRRFGETEANRSPSRPKQSRRYPLDRRGVPCRWVDNWPQLRHGRRRRA